MELFDGVIQRDGLRDACSAGLDRIKLKLHANIRAIEAYELLIGVAAGAMLQIRNRRFQSLMESRRMLLKERESRAHVSET